jgi:hypothetical protein
VVSWCQSQQVLSAILHPCLLGPPAPLQYHGRPFAVTCPVSMSQRARSDARHQLTIQWSFFLALNLAEDQDIAHVTYFKTPIISRSGHVLPFEPYYQCCCHLPTLKTATKYQDIAHIAYQDSCCLKIRAFAALQPH